MNEVYSFRSTEIALYFYLLKVNNLCSWRESFDHNNQKVLSSIGLTDVRTLNSARNRLKQAGLIDFKTKSGSASAQYSLKTYAKNVEDYAEVSAEVHVEDVSSLVSTKDKLNKTKNNKESKKENPPTKVPPKEKQEVGNSESEKSFKQLTQIEFYNSLKPFVKEFGKQTVRDFYDYWIEPSASGVMKFQLEKTWSTKGRLGTWKRNEGKFGVKTQTVTKADNLQPEILGPWAS